MRHIRFLKNEVERLKKSLRTTELQRKWPLNLSHDPSECGLWRGRCPQVLIKDVIGKTDPLLGYKLWGANSSNTQSWVVFHRPERTGYFLALSDTVYILVTFHWSHYTWRYLRVYEEVELYSDQLQACSKVCVGLKQPFYPPFFFWKGYPLHISIRWFLFGGCTFVEFATWGQIVTNIAS